MTKRPQQDSPMTKRPHQDSTMTKHMQKDALPANAHGHST
jgi:hypothetical protein